MINGFNKTTKKLVVCIIICLILLGICVTVDNADETITNIDNNTTLKKMQENVTLINDTYYVSTGDGMASTDGKIYHEKPDYPTVTITARPSVRSNYAYKWYTTTWIDYCPHCHRYGVLYNAHKYPARHEQELTCKICGADYCGVVGKEKYTWSHYYLRRA